MTRSQSSHPPNQSLQRGGVMTFPAAGLSYESNLLLQHMTVVVPLGSLVGVGLRTGTMLVASVFSLTADFPLALDESSPCAP